MDETAILMIMATGLIFSFLHTASPTGATIRRVATLSINADIKPENKDINIVTHITFGAIARILSAIRFGIFDSMK